MLESVQKQAMQVIFPGFLYEDALHLAGLDPLYVRRVDSCKSFVIKAEKFLRVIYLPNVMEHDRNLRSGNKTVYPTLGRTARLRHCLHGRGFICNRIGFDAVTPFVYTEPAEFVIKTGSF